MRKSSEDYMTPAEYEYISKRRAEIDELLFNIRYQFESGGDVVAVGASLADLFVAGFNLGRNSVADLS